MAPFRWGIIGPGRIARKFASSLPFSRNGKLVAVASTDANRAMAFAAEFRAEHAFSSYSEMLEKALPDAVYIATPHPFHYQPALLALEAGIPVLCEKPMTDSRRQTFALAEAARQKKVFLMEGMWSWFLPHMQQARRWIEEGEIGKLVHIQADFGYRALRDPAGRLFNPALGGGVALDLAIYPMGLFYKLLGPDLEFQAMGSRAPETGVDEHLVIQGRSAGGATFQSVLSFLAHTETRALVYGSEGRIEFSKQWFRAVSATLVRGEETRTITCPADGFGFQFEADEVENCVRSGLTSSPDWTPEDSIRIAGWIEKLESLV